VHPSGIPVSGPADLISISCRSLVVSTRLSLKLIISIDSYPLKSFLMHTHINRDSGFVNGITHVLAKTLIEHTRKS